MPLSPAIIAAESRPLMSIIGDRVRCLIDGAATGGAFSLFELRTPPGAGTPPHVHRREDETFHILEGRVEFWVDGKTTVAGPGTTVFGPRGVPHAFRNVGEAPIHALMVVSPAGLEEFLARMSKLAPEPPPPMPEFVRLCGEFGIELMPPAG